MARKRKHRCEPHINEIADLLRDGKTYRQVGEYLFEKYQIDVSESELSVFSRNHGIKNLIQHGRHNNPVCAECPDYIEIGAKHLLSSGRKSNIRVCKAVLEAIPNNVHSSPEWCKRRHED